MNYVKTSEIRDVTLVVKLWNPDISKEDIASVCATLEAMKAPYYMKCNIYNSQMSTIANLVIRNGLSFSYSKADNDEDSMDFEAFFIKVVHGGGVHYKAGPVGVSKPANGAKLYTLWETMRQQDRPMKWLDRASINKYFNGSLDLRQITNQAVLKAARGGA